MYILFLNLLQQNIITLLMGLLYLISCSIPYSEHTDNNIDKPLDEGAIYHIYIYINEGRVIHRAFILFTFVTEIIHVNTKR